MEGAILFTGRASCIYLIARFAEVVTPAPTPPPPQKKIVTVFS